MMAMQPGLKKRYGMAVGYISILLPYREDLELRHDNKTFPHTFCGQESHLL